MQRAAPCTAIVSGGSPYSRCKNGFPQTGACYFGGVPICCNEAVCAHLYEQWGGKPPDRLRCESPENLSGSSPPEPVEGADDAALEAMRAQKDTAYTERNKVVAALAKLFPSGIKRDNILDDWSLVYIDLPTGQVSWHYHDSEAPLFADLPPYTSEWDGHTTEEKYERLAALTGSSREERDAAVDERDPLAGPVG